MMNQLRSDVQMKKETFHQLKLSNGDYLRALDRLGFTEPTPIQSKGIPLGLDERVNLIAQAKAGTGKTLTFTSILIERLLRCQSQIEKETSPLAIIILPTRELAIQVFEFIEKVLTTLREINPKLLPYISSGIFIGGLPLQDDRRNLKMQHVKIVIGTIGRVIALIKEDSLSLSNVNTLILDEADKLMGQKDFYKHIQFIFQALDKMQNNNNNIKSEDASKDAEQSSESKKVIQYLAFSATYPEDLKGKIEKLMGKSLFVDAIAEQSNQDKNQIEDGSEERDLNLTNVLQFRVDIGMKNSALSITKQKVAAVVDLLKKIEFTQAIIFYNDKMKGDNLHSEIKAAGYESTFIHGDQSQADRIRLMNSIRRNKTSVIIATDLLARGIDIASIDLVINYDMPASMETYYHRVGRTGRYGRFGVTVLLAQKSDEPFIDQHVVDFCRLQPLPSDFEEVNVRLKQKQSDLVEESKVKNQSAAINNPQKVLPTTYHHEFTQGIIREAVDIEEKYYDESNFKYFEEDGSQACSPVILNQDGVNELSGSMSLYSDDGDEEGDDEEEEDDVSDDVVDNAEERVQEKQKKQKEGGDHRANKRANKSQIQQHTHATNDEWGFLNCDTCFRFLNEQQEKLGRSFKILKYFIRNQ